MSGGEPAASVSNNGSLQRAREFRGSKFIADLLTGFEKQLTVPKTLPWVPHVYDSSGLLDFRLRMRMQNAWAVAEEPDMLVLQRYAWRTFENRFGGVSTRRTIELMPTNISWEVLGQPNSTDQLLWCQHLQMQIAGIVFEYGHCTGRICPHTGRTEIIAPEVQMLYAENVPRWNRDIVEHPNLVCVPRRASHRAFQGAPTTTFPTVFSNEVLDELWGWLQHILMWGQKCGRQLEIKIERKYYHEAISQHPPLDSDEAWLRRNGPAGTMRVPKQFAKACRPYNQRKREEGHTAMTRQIFTVGRMQLQGAKPQIQTPVCASFSQRA